MGHAIAEFRRQGGKVYAVYTGRRSRALLAPSREAIDATDCDIPIDRVLVLVRDERGFAGCVVTPLLDDDELTIDSTDSSPRDRDTYDTIRELVSYDDNKARVVHDQLMTKRAVERPSWNRLVSDASYTAIRRLEKYGPMDLPADATTRTAACRALGHMRSRTAQPYLRADRPVVRRTNDSAGSSTTSSKTKRREPGSDNDLTALVRLRKEFEANGGRIVVYKTASARPAFDPHDGYRRNIVVAVAPDGRAGWAIWRARESDVARAGNARRVRQQMAKAQIAGLVSNRPSYYVPFDLMKHVGTAMRRCAARPDRVDPSASAEDLARHVLATLAQRAAPARA
jgi:hypothetical protein